MKRRDAILGVALCGTALSMRVTDGDWIRYRWAAKLYQEFHKIVFARTLYRPEPTRIRMTITDENNDAVYRSDKEYESFGRGLIFPITSNYRYGEPSIILVESSTPLLVYFKP